MTKKSIHKLSSDERKDAQRRTTPGVAVVYEAIRREAEAVLERPNAALFWSGLAAGLSIGFSFLSQALLQTSLPDTSWQSLVSKLGYSVGFVIVILGRQQLFTENTLTPVLQVLKKKTLTSLKDTLRLWGVVLSANLIGTLAFALILATTDIIDSSNTPVLKSIALHALHGDYWNTLLRAIYAGWMIALMVWLLPVAENSRLVVIVIITYMVSVAGFPHIIAGSSEVFYALATGIVTPGIAIGEFFIPTLIGNTIGGVLLVSAINYAQLAPYEK